MAHMCTYNFISSDRQISQNTSYVLSSIHCMYILYIVHVNQVKIRVVILPSMNITFTSTLQREKLFEKDKIITKINLLDEYTKAITIIKSISVYQNLVGRLKIYTLPPDATSLRGLIYYKPPELYLCYRLENKYICIVIFFIIQNIIFVARFKVEILYKEKQVSRKKNNSPKYNFQVRREELSKQRNY